MAAKTQPSFIKNKLAARIVSIAVFWTAFLIIYWGGMRSGCSRRWPRRSWP